MKTAPCICGQEPKKPCSLHDTTPEMSLAFNTLRKLDPTQRARIFCWFCPNCGDEIPPGKDCSCGGK